MHWNEGQLNIPIIFIFLPVLTLLVIQSVKSNEITLECLPESKGNFSSQIGSAVIYDIVNDTEEDGARIYCSVQDWPGIYAKMELRLLGEPPNQLFLEIIGETLLQLKNSVINCCTKYIFESNRESHLIHEEVNSRQNTTGVVRYKCNGQHPLRIDLDGLELLTKNFNSHAVSERAALPDVEISQNNCVTVGKNDDHSELGQPCDCNYDGCSRWMFDESGIFGCRRCCADSFWDLEKNDPKHRKGVCRKCLPHTTTPRPNTLTSCMTEDPSLKKPSTTTTTESPTTQPKADPPTKETVPTEGSTKQFTTPDDLPPPPKGFTQSPKLQGTTTEEIEKGVETTTPTIHANYFPVWIIVFPVVFGIALCAFCLYKRFKKDTPSPSSPTPYQAVQVNP